MFPTMDGHGFLSVVAEDHKIKILQIDSSDPTVFRKLIEYELAPTEGNKPRSACFQLLLLTSKY